MVGLDNAKVCISSRKDNLFDHSLRATSKILLHELNKGDISRFVDAQLRPAFNLQSPPSSDDPIQKLRQAIVEKAHGVFLWATLAAKDVCKGIRDKNPIQELRERVDSFHPQLEKLFLQLLGKIEARYHARAARHFNILLASEDVSLLLIDFVLATEECVHNVHSEETRRFLAACQREQSVHAFSPWATENKARISAVCGDLISIGRPAVASFTESFGPDWQIQAGTKRPPVDFIEGYVYFIHRTVRDFFEHSRDGQAFLSCDTTSECVPELSLARAFLRRAWIVAALNPSESKLHFNSIEKIFIFALLIQERHAHLLTNLVSEIDQGLQSAVNLFTNPEPDRQQRHWSHFVQFDWLNIHIWSTKKHFRLRVSDTSGALTAFGLNTYVRERVLQSRSFQTTEYLTYLLLLTNVCHTFKGGLTPDYASVALLSRMKAISLSLDFACDLLALGAKPNAYLHVHCLCKSPWQFFLRFLRTTRRFKSLLPSGNHEPVHRALSEKVGRTLSTYVRSGASLKETILRKYRPRVGKFPRVLAMYDISGALSGYYSWLQDIDQTWDIPVEQWVDQPIESRHLLKIQRLMRDHWGRLLFKVDSILSPPRLYESRIRYEVGRGDLKYPYTLVKHRRMLKPKPPIGKSSKFVKLNKQQSNDITRAIKLCEASWVYSRSGGPDCSHLYREYRRICLELELEDEIWIQSKSLMASICDPVSMTDRRRLIDFEPLARTQIFEDENIARSPPLEFKTECGSPLDRYRAFEPISAIITP